MGRENVKNTMIDKMLEFVAPHLCSGCGKIGSPLCDHCKYDIINLPFTTCILCNRPNYDGICKRHTMPYRTAWVVGYRAGVLQRLIGGIKFQNMKAAARNLSGLLDERLPPLPDSAVLVPIPTAPAHIRERGYDHMQLIAQYLGLRRHLPVVRLLGRGNTATQHHANRKDRVLQAQSAFTLTGPVDPNTAYVLLDDVITTGSTIEQAARVLREAGARFIAVGALARQPLD